VNPPCGEAFGDGAFREWQIHFGQRISELAVALEMGDAGLLSAQLGWTRVAFEARGIPAGRVGTSLQALHDALRGGSAGRGVGRSRLRVIDEAIERDRAGREGDEELMPADAHGELALRYLEAALTGDRRRAVRLILGAAKGGMPIEALYERVLLAAQAEVGRMWHAGELSVPEEHIATETTRSAMAALAQEAPPPAPDARTVVVAAAEGDRHDIGVRAVADLFELAGFGVVCVGGDVPAEELAMAVAGFEADVLVLSAAMSVHLPLVEAGVRGSRAARAGLRVIVGGPAFVGSEQLAARVGADAMATSPSHAVRIAERMLAERE
jgi:methanogenic corrinoid protein MtbC1